jgi:hypothetical protein
MLDRVPYGLERRLYCPYRDEFVISHADNLKRKAANEKSFSLAAANIMEPYFFGDSLFAK